MRLRKRPAAGRLLWWWAVTAAIAGVVTVPPAGAATRMPLPASLRVRRASPHFVVRSDVPAASLRAGEILTALETQYADFHRRFQLKAGKQGRLPILVFARKEDFQQWRRLVRHRLSAAGVGPQHKKLPEEDAAREWFIGGFYEPNTPAVAVVWKEDRDDVFRVMFHEVTHHFVHLTLPNIDPPLWMNEGLATYFETGKIRNGVLTTGLIPSQRAAMIQTALRENRHLPLERFVRVGRKDYGVLCYAEGWSLVYFFAKAGYGGRFGKYVGLLRKGEENVRAFRRAFGTTPAALEPVWRRFIMRVKAETKTTPPVSNDEEAMALYDHAVRAYNKRDFVGALRLVEQALRRDARFAAALHLRARCLYSQNRPEEALRAFDSALRVAPGDAQSLLCRAVLLRNKRRADPRAVSERELVTAWRAALKADAEQVVPRLELAQIYVNSGDPRLHDTKYAVRLAREAVRLHDDHMARRILAYCLFKDGRLDEAIAETRKILAGRPPQREYYEDMLRRLLRRKKHTQR